MLLATKHHIFQFNKITPSCHFWPALYLYTRNNICQCVCACLLLNSKPMKPSSLKLCMHTKGTTPRKCMSENCVFVFCVQWSATYGLPSDVSHGTLHDTTQMFETLMSYDCNVHYPGASPVQVTGIAYVEYMHGHHWCQIEQTPSLLLDQKQRA